MRMASVPRWKPGRGRRQLTGAAWLLLFIGCGDDGRLPLFPATGRVLVGGQPAAGVEVRLYPVDRLGDMDALRPFATTGEDGGFQLGTYEEADGAPAGRYKATLFWPDRPPGPSPPDDRLGGQYTDPARSALEVTIAEGENPLEPFSVPAVAAPAKRRPSRPARPDFDGLDIVPPS